MKPRGLLRVIDAKVRLLQRVRIHKVYARVEVVFRFSSVVGLGPQYSIRILF